MARRDKHQLGRALAISVGLHLAVLSLQFGLSGKSWPALGWDWGKREASVPLPSRRVELRAGSVETAVTPSSPLPVQLPVARTTATPDMPHTLIVTLLPPPLPKSVPTPPVLPQPAQQQLTPPPVPVVHKKIRGKKGSPILSVAQASSDEPWFVPPMATGDKTGKKAEEEPSTPPPPSPAITEPKQTPPSQDVLTPAPALAETETQTKLREQEQQALHARERAEQEQRQLAERAQAERVAARALQRQKEEAEARAEAQAEEVRRKAEQEAMAKKAAEEAAKAEAAALRQRAEAQAKEEQERARALEKARQEQERLRLAAAQMREAEEKRKAMEAERLAEEQRREAEKLAERRKAEALAAAEAQARAEAQAQAQAEAAARAAREAAARYQQEQQSLAAERARAATSSNANTNASTAGKNDAARKGASLATQALSMARRGDDALPGKAPTDKDNAHLAERPARSSFLGRNPNEIQLSFYGDSWEEKIRRIGNINYPRVPRDSAYGSVVVSVRIRSNGSLESVSILKSSGNREIDQATRRIIEMCAPFAAFPPDLRRNFDVIEVRRTLTFPDHPPLFISQ